MRGTIYFLEEYPNFIKWPPASIALPLEDPTS